MWCYNNSHPMPGGVVLVFGFLVFHTSHPVSPQGRGRNKCFPESSRCYVLAWLSTDPEVGRAPHPGALPASPQPKNKSVVLSLSRIWARTGRQARKAPACSGVAQLRLFMSLVPTQCGKCLCFPLHSSPEIVHPRENT